MTPFRWLVLAGVFFICSMVIYTIGGDFRVDFMAFRKKRYYILYRIFDGLGAVCVIIAMITRFF